MTAVDAGAAYRDAGLPVAERVADLLARMTLEEKVAQLGSAWVFQLADRNGIDTAKATNLLRDGIGQITRISGASSFRPAESAAIANAIQRHLLTETRLGVPAIVHEEICSGLMARDATIFPQAIGVASTWQPELATALADAVREQMRAVGAHQGLSPVLDVCRDPRWGRIEETFGEDPYLVARMGVAFVRGLQGAHGELTDGVVATAKHFVGYGASEGGLNWAPPHIGPRELHEVYLHPFESAVCTADLRSVMNAYNEIDGIPAGADRGLLTGVLRDQWGFGGYVVSDYFSIRQLADYHQLAADPEEAAAIAVEAGLDVELPGTDCYGAPLLAAVRSGRVDETVVDTAVARVLNTKFELGLFERPFVDADRAVAATGTAAQRRLARDVAAKSLVLLRNDGTLPLRADVASVALIGPNAGDARHLIGDYTYPVHVESLQEVLRSGNNVFAIPIDDDHRFDPVELRASSVAAELAAGAGAVVRFAPGCDVHSRSRDGFAEAVALAAASDVAVLVMGDKSGLTDDCTSGESRDVTSLDLPGVQEDLALAVLETGTPVVLVLVAGRPLGSASLHERCAAVLMAWLPGEEGAAAIVAALTGDLSPGGKLPISYPRSAGQIPTYYGHKLSGGRSHWKGDYVDSPASPLYPFGHGMSYTTFALGDAALARVRVSWNDAITTTVTVTNTGSREGDEVVQLYVRDPRASVTRPVLELKGFVRVTLAAGASRSVTFETPVAQLGFYDRQLEYVVEPGVIDVFVGTSSDDLTTVGSVEVVADQGDPPAKAFDGIVTVSREMRREIR